MSYEIWTAPRNSGIIAVEHSTGYDRHKDAAKAGGSIAPELEVFIVNTVEQPDGDFKTNVWLRNGAPGRYTFNYVR